MQTGAVPLGTSNEGRGLQCNRWSSVFGWAKQGCMDESQARCKEPSTVWCDVAWAIAGLSDCLPGTPAKHHISWLRICMWCHRLTPCKPCAFSAVRRCVGLRLAVNK